MDRRHLIQTIAGRISVFLDVCPAMLLLSPAHMVATYLHAVSHADLDTNKDSILDYDIPMGSSIPGHNQQATESPRSLAARLASSYNANRCATGI